jgi:hypothetical protein
MTNAYDVETVSVHARWIASPSPNISLKRRKIDVSLQRAQRKN